MDLLQPVVIRIESVDNIYDEAMTRGLPVPGSSIVFDALNSSSENSTMLMITFM